MFNVLDYVTRKSYDNDIIFKIIDIKDGIYYLKGVCVRLLADSNIDDLQIYNGVVDDKFENDIIECEELNRDEFFYLPGKILHIDGDNEYLKRCMKYYEKNKIKAYGIYLKEDYISKNIIGYLNKYNPDILVITGHDAIYRKRKRDGLYKNTSSFVNAIREARKYEKSQDKLIIVAGACQSNYEELIKAGANFASSPKRVNIHALDPAIVASSLALSDRNKNIDLINILEKTKYGSSGMGGIITKGTMYMGYPRE